MLNDSGNCTASHDAPDSKGSCIAVIGWGVFPNAVASINADSQKANGGRTLAAP